MKESIRGDRVCFRPLDDAPCAAASPQPLVYFPRSAEKYMPNSEHERNGGLRYTKRTISCFLSLKKGQLLIESTVHRVNR